MPSLTFKPLIIDDYTATIRDAMAQGTDCFHLRPDNAFAQSLAQILRDISPETKITVSDDVGSAENQVLCDDGEKYLSATLMDYVDVDIVSILAPITKHFWNKRPLFLISIPKSGTHLLYALAKAFGYAAGVICPENPKPGCWYCVEHSNSHTVARDFFIDGIRRAPFGNRAHPFMQNPALFIYRNPMDILVSEANYYHKETSSPFHSYFSGLSFEERLNSLIDDRWLFGSIRDRVGGFIPWMNLGNVASISFEELVGNNGGGNDLEQQRLIWSLQLKLHVPGTPEEFSTGIFDPESPTFHEGKIGSHLEQMPEEAKGKFEALPQDFMAAFGFATETDALPTHAKAYRHRPLICADATFDDVSILLERGFLEHSLLRYSNRTYAVSEGIGEVAIESLSAHDRNGYLNAPTTEEVKHSLANNTFIGHRILCYGNDFFAVPIDWPISTVKDLTDNERSSLKSAPSIDALKQRLVHGLVQRHVPELVPALVVSLCNELLCNKFPFEAITSDPTNIYHKVVNGYSIFVDTNHYYAIPDAALPPDPERGVLYTANPNMLVAHSYRGLVLRVVLRRVHNFFRLNKQS